MIDFKNLEMLLKDFKAKKNLSNRDVANLSGIKYRFIIDVSSGAISKETSNYTASSRKSQSYGAALQEFLTTSTNNITKECDSQVTKLDNKIEELKKEKYKLNSIKNSYNKEVRNQAYLEEKLDYLEQAFEKYGKSKFKFISSNNIPSTSSKDMIVMISDLHIAQCFESYWGSYNLDLARKRLQQFLNKLVELVNLYCPENCYITLQGDMISGNIHKSITVSNAKDVVDQIMIASELVTDFIEATSYYFNNVFVAEVTGNHSRIDRKEDAIKSERLDKFISYYASKVLSHYDNIKFIQSPFSKEDNIDNTISKIIVRGKDYLIVHGDYDPIQNQSKVDQLCRFAGIFPYAILAGHLHHPVFIEMNGTKVIQSGSLAGAGDDYTIQKRLIGRPSQTILLCSDKGIEGHFPVELD